MPRRPLAAAVALALGLGCLGCLGCKDTTPQSTVVVDNQYAPSSVGQLVVYQAQFQQAIFDTPLLPGSTSTSQSVAPTSGTPAYVVLAPGWDPTSDAGPTSFVVMTSNLPLAAPADKVADVVVSDATFRGRCDAGSFLTQQEADVIIGAFFSNVFANLKYDSASCATTQVTDAGSE